MRIHLHAFDTSNGRRISVALEERGLPCAVQLVDITRGERHDPALVAAA